MSNDRYSIDLVNTATFGRNIPQMTVGTVDEDSVMPHFMDRHQLVVMGAIRPAGDSQRRFLNEISENRAQLSLSIQGVDKQYSGRFYLAEYDEATDYVIFRSIGDVKGIASSLNGMAETESFAAAMVRKRKSHAFDDIPDWDD